MIRRRGAVLVEAVLVLPVLLMLIFAVIQFANVMIVQQVVEYAAYCGARATLTCNSMQANKRAKEAAKRVLAPVSLSTEDDSSSKGPHVYPGWGKLKGTKNLDKQVKVRLLPSPSMGAKKHCVGCKVTFDYPLLIPVPGYRTTAGKIQLTGKAVLPLRYSTRKYPRTIR